MKVTRSLMGKILLLNVNTDIFLGYFECKRE